MMNGHATENGEVPPDFAFIIPHSVFIIRGAGAGPLPNLRGYLTQLPRIAILSDLSVCF
jgi:hypothetical protein